MADCTCANPQAVSAAISSAAGTTSTATTTAAQMIDQTMYGQLMGGMHGAPAPVRFCHWNAPTAGRISENMWTNVWQAAQLAVALLNSIIQGQIADKMQDLADSYYQHAKYKWNRFNEKYKPLEVALLEETSSVAEPSMDCADDRSRAESAVNTAYDHMDRYVARMAKALRLCIDDTQVAQLEYGRNLMLVDTENYNLRDDQWFVDFKSDQRWNRRSNVLNLGRNLGAVAQKYGDVAKQLMGHVSATADKAAGTMIMQLGYYGNRFDTVYSSTYLGSGGLGSGTSLVNTAQSTINAANSGF